MKQPFVVLPDGSRWCVSMEHPVNPDDFVVVYRSEFRLDCERVCESLIGLFEEHLKVRGVKHE